MALSFSLITLLLYFALLIYLGYYWKHYHIPKELFSTTHMPFISIIIVGRNEAINIKKCIRSITKNKYPTSHYEIIYVDDHSSDNSKEVLNSLNIENLRVFQLKDAIGKSKINNFKKEAIRYAISKAKSEIILQTDADTFVGKEWILSHAKMFNNKSINIVTGPVLFQSKNSLLEQFQKYDLITTIGVTGAGIASTKYFMANGANMSYRKLKYIEVTEKSNYASGDDMFLVQSINKKYPGSVSFLNTSEAVVTTYPENCITDLFKQRLRWATKTNSYTNTNLKLLVLLVFLANFIILFNAIIIPFFGLYQLIFLLELLIAKLFVDVGFVVMVARFFQQKINFPYLILSLILYPFYIVIIGITSLFVKNYNWKGRIVK